MSVGVRSLQSAQGSAWLEVPERLQGLFNRGLYRVYTTRDVVGVEVAGALKNVIAIAAGMADGMGVGDNTRALVITRGFAEPGATASVPIAREIYRVVHGDITAREAYRGLVRRPPRAETQ